MQHIGEFVKLFREKRGLTQKQLGELIGITERGIRMIETGDRIPRAETLDRICEVLELNVEYKVTDRKQNN